ncbi:MAG: beta-galactosidase trimerization domain-containing protein, partial [Lachnospiraceae bacterium]|nr:beta-galactosidase trimerization domain-containing protein [Lachnospiraceae bacterium]
ILTNRSGVKDENNNCIQAPLPTVYSKLTGCYVEEYDPIGNDSVQIQFGDGHVFTGKRWCDVLATDTAEVVAVYDSNFYKGSAAITENSYGNGRVYYIGTVGEKRLYREIALKILKDLGISYIDRLPDNVEVTTREGEGVSARFIFNNTDASQDFMLDGRELSLMPFEMKIEVSEK